MKIDKEKKELYLSVRELANSSQDRALKHSSRLPRRIKAVIGQGAHQNYQNMASEKHENSKNEYYIKISIKVKGWTVIIKGRADVVYEEDDELIIEEVKSTTSQTSLDEHDPHHILQLQLYAHYFTSLGKTVRCYLVYYYLPTDSFSKYEVEPEDQEEFIHEQCSHILSLSEEQETRNHTLSQRAETIKFPFNQYRPNQKEIIQKIYDGYAKNSRMLLLAPSGLGKTVGSLLPGVQYAIEHNLRLFVATSKTTQQRIYRDTLKKMVKTGGEFHAIILTAKEKMCINTEFICDISVCPFLVDYEKKCQSIQLDTILNKKVIEANAIKKVARQSVICPFELSLDVSLHCDIIIGDFNYIFHPGIRLQRYFMQDYKDSMLIVDEAHNLPARANDYYSPSISLSHISNTKQFLKDTRIPKANKAQGNRILQSLYRYILNFADDIQYNNEQKVGEVIIEEKAIRSIHKKYDLFVVEYIKELSRGSDRVPDFSDPIINFGENLKYFFTILKDSYTPEFSHLYYLDEWELKILCKSAWKKLAKQIKGFHSVVAQSATLYPLDYYRKMIGFPNKSIMMEHSSPFPKENQLYLIYPNISTRYQVRRNFYGKIADIIVKAINCKHGNYLAFFPSFSVLEAVKEELSYQSLELDLLTQEKSMSERKRKNFLRKLNHKSKKYLLLGVHGGIFSEGVDFLGEMAIGVFIVGPALPAFTFERELVKTYFEEDSNNGFEYAYRNPGMNKVIQAAGRIFRSSEDKGVVMLLGTRFKTPFYSSIIPSSWECTVTSDPIEVIDEFWNNSDESRLDQFWDE
ncbi:MAG: ATP-dependent DNA helicase [Candidatus Kariarchaeaceae archaeon]